VVLFVTSGVFRVKENEKALVLQFGRIRGQGTEQRVLDSGLHWAWPEPICEIVTIPVTRKQTLAIDSFWYFQTEAEKLGTEQPRIRETLNPIWDGYCLTRNDRISGTEGTDYNIVHAKWTLTYLISDPEKFFQNVYFRSSRPGEDFMDVAGETVEPLLRTIAADAVVSTMVKYSIEEAIRSENAIANDVARAIEARLLQIRSGIDVVSVQADKITWPRQVNRAFEEATMVTQASTKMRDEARSYAKTTLSEAGGADAKNILAALRNPSTTKEDRQLRLDQLEGASHEIISKARAARVQAVAGAEANAQYLKELLPEYRKYPKLVLQRIYQEAIAEVLDNADEKFIVQTATEGTDQEIRINIGRDPSISKSK
ncbi:MAG: hypothetical protein KAR47_08610, partial [Planctomycetes bacterium]|nr:hypothetical protein [Planctomycetota bacterium]